MVGKRLVVVAWAAAGVAWAGRAAWGAEFLVHDATEVTAAQGSARPGDVIVMADGVWTDQKITLSASGSAAVGGGGHAAGADLGAGGADGGVDADDQRGL